MTSTLQFVVLKQYKDFIIITINPYINNRKRKSML